MEEQNPDHTADGAAEAVPGKRGDEAQGRGFFGNLRCGVRLALFRRVAPDGLSTAPGDLVLLVLADLALNLAISFLLVGGEGVFNYTSLPGFLFHLPLMLLCGLLAGRLLNQPGLLTALPAALISVSIPLELLHGLLEGAVELGWGTWLDTYLDASHYYRFFWWWVAAAALFTMRTAPPRYLRRLASGIIFLAFLVLPLWVFPRGDLWVRDAAEGEGELRLTEEVLVTQPKLLEERLDALMPGRKGVVDLYFIGFAGDGSQDVFMKELTVVELLFKERFDTVGRTVALVNNPRTALIRPFATATNLARALKRIGQVMDQDEDILFLYLTSHGSEGHELALENRPLELEPINPEDVRRMIDASGVRWKVIAVSACYSGGFIEPLKDDHTLIMTAADASHDSFGCSSDSDFTWFGRAYFDEALRGTYSFTEAFARARKTVREREEREGETPSNPQIFVGEAMRAKLAALEARLASGEKGARQGVSPGTAR